MLQVIKDSFDLTGVTITSDGWQDVHSRPLLNMLACSPRGEMFVKAVDTSGHLKTADYIADQLEQVLMHVGAQRVVQVLSFTCTHMCAHFSSILVLYN